MKYEFLRKSYKELKGSSKFILVSNSVLTVALTISLIGNLTEDVVVISNVNPTCDVMSISSSNMNPDTHKRLGYFLASSLGNITPESVDYVSSMILAYMSPEIYSEMQERIALQIKSIKEDEVTISFSPEASSFESGSTPKIFITGKQTITGATGKSKTSVKTYEFHFKVSNYTPTVKWVDLYAGLPHDRKWFAKQKDKASKNDK